MTFFLRCVGAARLDRQTFEEVEADRAATPQAAGVIVLSSLSAGLGSAGLGALSPDAILAATAIALAGWLAWAALTYLIGTHLLPEAQTRATLAELFRTLGFSTAPGVLRVVGLVAPVRTLVFLVVTVWMIAAMVVAVRQALDYRSTPRAIAVCVVAWALSLGVAMAIGLAFGTPVS